MYKLGEPKAFAIINFARNGLHNRMWSELVHPVMKVGTPARKNQDAQKRELATAGNQSLAEGLIVTTLE